MRRTQIIALALPAFYAAQALPSSAQVYLEEITVTATKRSESLQDVPLAISAISMSTIEKRGFDNFNDYLPMIPGVAFQDRGAGRNKVVIRGISSGTDPAETPTVATYFGEVLVSVLPTTQQSSPDIKLFDIERVEVLRGPQGTLYGAGSMGGTVRILPAAPNLGAYEVLAQASLNTTAHSGKVGYDFAGAVNVPILEDKLAVRVAAYHYLDAGFIDNVVTPIPEFDVPDFSKKDVNDVTVTGVRVSAKLQATDRLSVTAMLFYQDTDADALQEHSSGKARDFTQERFTPEKLADRIKIANLDLSYDADAFNFFSTTAYLERNTKQTRDIYGFFGIPAGLLDNQDGNFFSQEFRMSSQSEGPFQWIGGVYYSLEKGKARQNGKFSGTTVDAERRFQNLLIGAPVLGPDDDPFLWVSSTTRPETQQIAAFGELAYTIADRLTATVGGRWMKYDQSVERAGEESLLEGPAVTSSVHMSEKTLTPKFHVKYAYNDDVNFYAQAAKGFRIGGTNQPLSNLCDADLANLGLTAAPVSTRSDSIWSYELGAKARLADGRVTLNTALFKVNWDNIQTSIVLPNCGFQFASNAGKASSKGIEAELVAALGDAFSLDISASYIDAVLEEDTLAETGLDGRKGDRLPGLPKYNLHGGLQYDFAVSDRADAFLRTDVSYVGAYYNNFTNARLGEGKSGDYVLLDFRAGISFDAWSVEAFVKNALNKTVILLRDPEFADGRETVGRPRMIGLTARYRL